METNKVNYYETYKKKYPDVVKTTIGTVFPFNALQAQPRSLRRRHAEDSSRWHRQEQRKR